MIDRDKLTYEQPTVVGMGSSARGAGQVAVCDVGFSNTIGGCYDGGANAADRCYNGDVNQGAQCTTGQEDDPAQA